MAHDPREIANFVLDVAHDMGRTTTNLGLNKIVYFLHGVYLTRRNEPLVDAKIEAWEYGPVFREIYHACKDSKNGPILSKVRKKDFETGEVKEYSYSFTDQDAEMLRKLAESYLKIAPGKLVNMSHVEDGPWYAAWHHQGNVNPGMEITNDAIRQHFVESARH